MNSPDDVGDEWMKKRIRLPKARLKEFDKEDGDGKVYNK